MALVVMRRRHFAGAVLILGAFDQVPTEAEPSATGNTNCAAYAREAASRSGLATEIVLRVMAAESGGDPDVVSRKGAMGCMQIMPATWAYLTDRYRLGGDPFDPRANMIAGAAYLAELTIRYGMPGALAAYNAGPARYDRYVAGRAALPSETIAYTKRIARGSMKLSLPPISRWEDAGLFVGRAVTFGIEAQSSPPTRSRSRDIDNPLFPLTADDPDDRAASAGP